MLPFSASMQSACVATVANDRGAIIPSFSFGGNATNASLLAVIVDDVNCEVGSLDHRMRRI